MKTLNRPRARARMEDEQEACAPFRPQRPLNEMLDDIARRVSRLTVSHRDPEAFFVARSELAHDLQRLARTLHRRRPGGS
jgi:hypothetical protein